MRDGAKRGDRERFIKANQVLFDMFDDKTTSNDWKIEPGKTIVEKAREQLKYSSTTPSCDIFWSLLRLHEKLKEKSINY